MPNRWTGITVDCADPARLAAFWSALLDRPVTAEHDTSDWATVGSRRDPQPRLTFQRVPEPKIGKVRLHLDVQVDAIDAGRAEVERLGGSWTGERHDYDEGVVLVMRDPEGHEFCLVEYATAPPAAARLRPMTPAEYETWHAADVESYAQDIARATGFPLEEVRDRAVAQFAELLPDGQDSPGVDLLTVVDGDGTAVGVVWLGQHPAREDAAYVYDLEIVANRRGEGLGRAAMQAAEEVVRASGRTAIGLNVFGFNAGARRLYESLGYRTVGTQMLKRLE